MGTSKGGTNMGFFIAAFILMIVATYHLNKSMDNDSKSAKASASSAETRVGFFNERITRLEARGSMMDTILREHKEAYDKLQQRYELLDVKTSAMRNPTYAPIKVQPIRLEVVYRTAKKKLPVSNTPDPVAEKVIKSVREKMRGINQ